MRRIERTGRRATVALVLASAMALLGCQAPAGRALLDVDLHDFAVEQIRTRYVDPVAEAQLQTSSLKGMLNGLDAHSNYLDEVEYRALLNETRGKYTGVGAMVRQIGTRLTIVAVLETAPAARAGLQPGDVITRIDGRPVEADAIEDAALRLQGRAGSPITLTIARDALAPFDVPMVREIIAERSVAARLEPDRIGYIRVVAFLERTEDELADAVGALQRKAGGQLGGLVLDLRGNPGGLFDVALDVAADFLDGGTVVMTRGRNPTDSTTYYAETGGDLTKGAPMAVLIDGGSASAAEIVAGALQDRSRAILVGTRSFGKGSVQTLIPLPPGQGALRITTARYYTPSGRSIQARGIDPDLEVPSGIEASATPPRPRREADLPRALGNPGPARPQARLLAPGGRPRAADLAVLAALPATSGDPQLAAAMALLRQLR